MQKFSLRDYLDKQSPAAWIGSMHRMMDEMACEIRNLKQKVKDHGERITHWKERTKVLEEWKDEKKLYKKTKNHCCISLYPYHSEACKNRPVGGGGGGSPKSRWPCIGDNYYYITAGGFLSEATWHGGTLDEQLLEAGNCFKDRILAGNASAKVIGLFKKLNPDV